MQTEVTSHSRYNTKKDLSCLKKYQAKIHIVQPFYYNGDVYLVFNDRRLDNTQSINHIYVTKCMHLYQYWCFLSNLNKFHHVVLVSQHFNWNEEIFSFNAITKKNQVNLCIIYKKCLCFVGVYIMNLLYISRRWHILLKKTCFVKRYSTQWNLLLFVISKKIKT